MAKKLTQAKLKTKIDQLGSLRAERSALEASERALSDEIRSGMGAVGLESLEASAFAAQIAAKQVLSIDAAKFRKKAGEELFLACAKIDNKEARRHFSDVQLARLGSVETRTELRISRRPSETA